MATIKQLSMAIQKSYEWHAGVEYGGGLVMTHQLNEMASAIDRYYQGEDKITVLITALLSKAWETKRQNEETKNNPNAGTSYTDLLKVFGQKVADNIADMATEPDTNDWYEMADWAKRQNSQVQTVLLAEKLQNFIVSRDNPNPKWAPSRHIDYYKSRMIMVESIKDTCSALYAECVKTAFQGMMVQRQKMIENQISNEPAVVVKVDGVQHLSAVHRCSVKHKI